MTSNELETRFEDLLRHCEEVYPVAAARIKFAKDADGQSILFIGNNSGYVHWGLRLAGSVILRRKLKPQLPEQNVIIDGDIVARDTEFDFGGFVCNEELRSEPHWTRTPHSRLRDAIGFIGCVTLICIALTILALAIYGARALWTGSGP